MSADDIDNPSASAYQDELRDELIRLNSLHDDLVEAVQTALNPAVRADLGAELRSVRERITELSRPGVELPALPDFGTDTRTAEVPSIAPGPPGRSSGSPNGVVTGPVGFFADNEDRSSGPFPGTNGHGEHTSPGLNGHDDDRAVASNGTGGANGNGAERAQPAGVNGLNGHDDRHPDDSSNGDPSTSTGIESGGEGADLGLDWETVAVPEPTDEPISLNGVSLHPLNDPLNDAREPEGPEQPANGQLIEPTTMAARSIGSSETDVDPGADSSDDDAELFAERDAERASDPVGAAFGDHDAVARPEDRELVGAFRADAGGSFRADRPEPGGRRAMPPSRGAGGPDGLGRSDQDRRILLLGVAAAAIVALVAIAGVGRLVSGDDGSEEASVEAGDPAGPDSSATVDSISSTLDAMGIAGLSVAEVDGTLALSGVVPDTETRAAALGAAAALAGGRPIEAAGLTVAEAAPTTIAPGAETTASAALVQRELARILAGTPIIFPTGATDVTERHQRILNAVVAALQGSPEVSVTVVGYTDDQGDPQTNQLISLARAESVRDYLVSQGVAADRLQLRGVGEEASTGAPRLAGLERRVEFAVAGIPGATVDAPAGTTLRIGMVAPSARSDLAFTQSMADALDRLASERSLEVSITDNTFVPDEALAAISTYAEQGYDLVVAHGSQFGAGLRDIAIAHPDVVFAWGTAADTFGLPNVYAYDAKAEQGGYVLGAMAASLSSSGRIGVIGPIPVGDAALYVNGFQAGAEAERIGTRVEVTYTDSFSDVALAAEAAQAHADNGADVMTGSAQMVVGAVEVAADRNIPWFGTQSDQSQLAPNLVVASQVYRWEVVLRPILDDVEQGVRAGRTSSLTLGNGGLEIVYNQEFAVPAEVRARADKLVGDITAGLLVVPA